MWSLEIKTWHQYWTDVSNFLLITLVVEISRCYLANDVSYGYWQTLPVVINGIYVSTYCRKWNKESQLNIWFVKMPKYIFTGVCDIAHNSFCFIISWCMCVILNTYNRKICTILIVYFYGVFGGECFIVLQLYVELSPIFVLILTSEDASTNVKKLNSCI